MKKERGKGRGERKECMVGKVGLKAKLPLETLWLRGKKRRGIFGWD